MTDGAERSDGTLARYKRPLLYVMGPLYVVAGVLHFLVPETYAGVIPPAFPEPIALAYLSGLAEIALGLGVLVPRTRRLSAWGLVALLLAIFPANVYMATSDIVVGQVTGSTRVLARLAVWARLPLQAVLVLWAWWYTRPVAGAG
jgi:uncharacterized membrane protein